MDAFVEPPFMRHMLAKSADRSETAEPETLARHTWLVLAKVVELAQLRPQLTQVAKTDDLWHLLYWTCFLHDFGKAAGGFQQQLHGVSWEGQRHEVLSLAFVDWIAANFTSEQCMWIVAAIASHHRDSKTITTKYMSAEAVTDAWSSFNHDDIPLLWRWLSELGNQWIEVLGLTAYGVRPLAVMDQATAVARTQSSAVQNICMYIKRYRRFIQELRKPHPPALELLILLRGLTTSADHMGSAHLQQMPPPIHESWQSLNQRILRGRFEPYRHQVQSAVHHSESALLIAPTGSGKTEAALYWALGDGTLPIPRIFYALPFQASMNAMFDRLRDPDTGFGRSVVGLQHGRALQALYLRLLNAENGLDARSAAAQERWERNINGLQARPLKVFSPYQMLKALFQIKGFEGMLSDYAQAAFIFDEIHAYEPERLALIMVMLEYLRRCFAARFFIMSATFPAIIRTKLAWALGTSAEIKADQTVYTKFQRHRLQLLDGDVLDAGNIERIVADFQAGKQVLVCANTVRRAQAICTALQAVIDPAKVVLIHSRFVIRDRSQLEQDVMQRSSLGLDNPQPFILVATQVVEVSLNIDLDVLYSEPAPLEALLQRFGRVNRACKKGLCPVYVFRQPIDGQGVYGRSKDPALRGRIVQVTLAELAQHNDQLIDESQVDLWLDRIYADPTLHTQWEDAYSSSLANAMQVMHALRPFDSDQATEAEFEKLFDNVDVLPQCFEQAYIDLINQHDYVEASRLFVGISQQRYAQFKDKGLIRQLDHDELKGQKWIIRLPYSEKTGLSFDVSDVDTYEDDWS